MNQCALRTNLGALCVGEAVRFVARIVASYTFADGDSVGVRVDIENDYPDALAEAVKTCSDMMREAMVNGLGVQDEGDAES